MSRLIIWGAGELGSLVAERYHGGPVLGLTRTAGRHEYLRSIGVEPAVGSAAPLLQQRDKLLISLPGDENKMDAVAELKGVARPRRAVLISSTGYYAPAQGTVNELTPSGTSGRAQRIASLERGFMEWAGAGGVVIRLGGLYRPGRGPMAALARRGTASVKPPNKALPLIHYVDAAEAVAAALQRSTVAPVYLAVTPPCPTRRQFYEAACRRLGLDVPDFSAPLPEGPARYEVRQLRNDLLPQPAFSDWRSALQMP